MDDHDVDAHPDEDAGLPLELERFAAAYRTELLAAAERRLAARSRCSRSGRPTRRHR